MSPSLTVSKFERAEQYWYQHYHTTLIVYCVWIHVCQGQHFFTGRNQLQSKQELHKSSPLLLLYPFLDSPNLLRVDGRITNSSLFLSQRHPIIIDGKHPLTKQANYSYWARAPSCKSNHAYFHDELPLPHSWIEACHLFCYSTMYYM